LQLNLSVLCHKQVHVKIPDTDHECQIYFLFNMGWTNNAIKEM